MIRPRCVCMSCGVLEGSRKHHRGFGACQCTCVTSQSGFIIGLVSPMDFTVGAPRYTQGERAIERVGGRRGSGGELEPFVSRGHKQNDRFTYRCPLPWPERLAGWGKHRGKSSFACHRLKSQKQTGQRRLTLPSWKSLHWVLETISRGLIETLWKGVGHV